MNMKLNLNTPGKHIAEGTGFKFFIKGQHKRAVIILEGEYTW